MRKLLFVCSLVLGFAAVQPVNAQFLKKMGKALGSALSASSTSSSSSSSSSSAIPHTKFVVTAYEYWGENVLIRFVVTNTSSENIDFEIGKVEAIDDKGRSHEVNIEVPNPKFCRDCTALPPGVPVKCYFVIKNVSNTCKSISRVSFSGDVSEGVGPKILPYKDYVISSRDILYAQNTNASNIFCSHPLLQYNLNSVEREGNDVLVNATVKNVCDEVLKISSCHDSSMVFDDEGNSYKMEATLAGNDFYWGKEVPSNVPLKLQLVIKNVPARIKNFSLIKYIFSSQSYNYPIEIKNQAIQ